VFAFVERHVRDALQESGVVLEGADLGPRHLVRRVAEVSALRSWSHAGIASISAFLETNAASASLCELMICFRGCMLIFQLQL
jgi:hypothetical protein